MKKAYQYSFLSGEKSPYASEYRVYSDGSHYIARRSVRKGGRRVRPKPKVEPECKIVFDLLYDQGIGEGLSGKALKEYIVMGFIEDYDYVESEILIAYVDQNIERKLRNCWQREKRFRRKAYLTEWNYFVTFTYDGKKHTEESFIKKLRKCLANLHSRRGWLYMGVTERGEESGRFHYHFLVHVPKGEMVGELYTRRDYSTKRGTIQETVGNTFFEARFGRTDFEEICMQANGGDAVNYCLKYMRKTNSRPIYSRGIPSELRMTLDSKYDFACEIDVDGSSDGYEFKRYVIYDSVIAQRLGILLLPVEFYHMNC